MFDWLDAECSSNKRAPSVRGMSHRLFQFNRRFECALMGYDNVGCATKTQGQ